MKTVLPDFDESESAITAAPCLQRLFELSGLLNQAVSYVSDDRLCGRGENFIGAHLLLLGVGTGHPEMPGLNPNQPPRANTGLAPS